MSLKSLLNNHTKEAAPELVEVLEGNSLRCLSCGNRCVIKDGGSGVCRVRFNKTGHLHVPWGYVAGLQVDPIEKKPFYHVFPGQDALSFGMLGCNFHCSFCQNWVSSQTLRDDQAVAKPTVVEPEELVALAVKQQAPVMVSTYNEPLITSDWAVDVFRLGRQEGIVCGFVSNGYATPEVLEYIRPYVDLYKIDLKSFSDTRYRDLGGVLQVVLDTIKLTYEMGFWVEIVTLLVPGFNDSEEEIKQISDFIASVSVDIPWHVTAFHPDYKMLTPAPTRAEQLIRAHEIGKQAGLKYVYVGNLPGGVGEREDTCCPNCSTTLIKRIGFRVQECSMNKGSCSKCGTSIAGVWGEKPITSGSGRVHPIPIERH